MLRWKKRLTLKGLCENNPTETLLLGEAIDKLDYHATPNYAEMMKILLRGRKKASFHPDTSPLDWEVNFKTVEEEERNREKEGGSRRGKGLVETNTKMTIAAASGKMSTK